MTPLDEHLFRKGETIVHDAIREALVNALIHADYQGQGGIVVNKYLDRFEFSNPGSLLVSFDQLFRGNISECRNKSLQTMFTMIGAAEKAGSGVDKIQNGWKSQHWGFPIVKEQVQPDRVEWILPMISLIPTDSLDRLQNLFGIDFASFDEIEIQALVTADIEGYVDNARMQQITNKHAADITATFQRLVNKRALIQEGQGRWTRYRLFIETISNQRSLHNGQRSLHNGQRLVDSNITKSQWNTLLLIAVAAKKNKRLSPKKMEEIILNLCRAHWLSLSQLSVLLNRNAENIRARYVQPLVRKGLLQLYFPDIPNHMNQAYRTTVSATQKCKAALQH